ncbi:Hypothetical protein, putative [Bodo saltans]|uniref:Uncharacterized protein n=1 Tax=Bodo saltans TaxID=75058 RepID=A0A0S4IV60_BODSA|nr:Hypothetical protein, putative [Bodo saltans]|eukprot:CUG01560.1 Hypothetical protein, putative [Bodo saltans]
MNFTLPTLIAERRDRSRFVEAVKASPSAPQPAAPLGNSEETQDAAADEHTKTSDNTYCELAEQLRRLECEEAVYFTQKLLIRCVAVEEDAREAIVNEWDAVIQPELMDAYVALCARSRRHVTQIETTVREKIGASAHHLLRLLHDQRHIEHEEQKERSTLAFTAMAAMVADHIECPWRSIAPRPPSEGVTKSDEVHAQTNVDADGTWPIVEPTDPLLAVRLLSPEMLELMPKDAVLQRSKCAHDVARDATRNMIHDTNTRAYIVASHYTRERAELSYDDEVKEENFTTPCSPSCLPGIVLPWSFVEDERNQRLWTSQEWERETAVLDGLLQLFQKVCPRWTPSTISEGPAHGAHRPFSTSVVVLLGR